MALKYLKDIEINIHNILIMIGDFNISYSNWDLSYPHHSTYSNILMEVADSFDLKSFSSVNQFPTQYANNSNDPNSVIDLIFL